MTRSIVRWGILLLLSVGAGLGWWSLQVHSQSDLLVGYATIERQADSTLPVATALFAFRNGEGILVAEAGVEAVEPIRRGRIFVDAAVPTGLALANPSGNAVTATLTLRDADGAEVDQKPLMIPAGEHRARFVSEAALFGALDESFVGSLTFETDTSGLASLTLRQSTNAHDEGLLATLPVAELEEPPQITSTPEEHGSQGEGIIPALIFPHLGAGGILSTQIILINPTSQALSGEIRLTGSNGLALELLLDGEPGSVFPYALAPNGVFQGTLTSSTDIFTGYAVITVDQGNGIPSGTAIFQFRDTLGNLVSEAGVGAVLPTTRARIFVDTIDTRTGVAIASPGNGPTEVTLRLLDRNGLEFAQTTRELAADGHLPIFVDELFEDLPVGFTGVLQIEAEVAIVPITLKLTINGRDDPILTTLPVADLTRPILAETLVFPQIGFGLGFSTRLILISSSDDDSLSNGLLTLTQSNGAALTVPLLGVTGSQFNYQVFAGGIRQLRPGNTAEPVQLILDASDLDMGEVVVNEGNRTVLHPLVIDSAGEIRDDFPSEYVNLDGQTAQVAATGEIGGMEAGFSTLTLQVGPLVATTTITVVRVTEGAAGFSTSGISQDLSGRLYLASPTRQQILVTTDLAEAPQVYAGVEQSGGLVNDVKLQSLFDDPRSMALNQADGSLYVADPANHVIRKIPLADRALVETLAGNGQAGSTDGTGVTAQFDRPSGVALDTRGRLWVTDTGNHSIRRVDLATQEVTTIAGVPGGPGFVNGQGNAARFNSPAGIAIQREPIAQQLQREFNGDPPPPTRVVVADRGNRALRIVSDDGTVETLEIQRRERPLSRAYDPLGNSGNTLMDPRGVASDPFGNVYVSEGEGQVTTILANGETVSAAQSGTFAAPQDVDVTQSGRVIVADSENTGRELIYGTPEILSVTPSASIIDVAVDIEVKGRNFFPPSSGRVRPGRGFLFRE